MGVGVEKLKVVTENWKSGREEVVKCEKREQKRQGSLPEDRLVVVKLTVGGGGRAT